MPQVPSGLLPVLEVEGRIITESAVIQQVGGGGGEWRACVWVGGGVGGWGGWGGWCVCVCVCVWGGGLGVGGWEARARFLVH
jgi:hypothetical protein